MLPQAILWLKQ
ncbi:hypothetical protein YPPY94_2771, partial [Yersinia pestis PY-94]